MIDSRLLINGQIYYATKSGNIEASSILYLCCLCALFQSRADIPYFFLKACENELRFQGVRLLDSCSLFFKDFKGSGYLILALYFLISRGQVT
jgi:hypothetical protein